MQPSAGGSHGSDDRHACFGYWRFGWNFSPLAAAPHLADPGAKAAEVQVATVGVVAQAVLVGAEAAVAVEAQLEAVTADAYDRVLLKPSICSDYIKSTMCKDYNHKTHIQLQ